MSIRRLLQPSGYHFAQPYLFFLFLFLPGILMAQQEKMTVKIEKGSLEKALTHLRTVSSISIAFNRQEAAAVEVSASEFRDQTLEQILKSLVKGLDFTVEKKGTAFLVRKTEMDKRPKGLATDPGPGIVSGIVTDRHTGTPVQGATIQAGSLLLLSDADGRFSFRRPVDIDSIAFSHTGYLTLQLVPTDQWLVASLQVDTAAALLKKVEVAGIRKSLSDALSLKRYADNIQDAIVAEDIAKFPQSNVSEALQRISGVQITRDYAGGLGNEISVRGLPPEYTQVTINGIAAPTGSDNRTFNFNILPAELFSKAVVSKSPTADMVEGGVAGTVELTTYKPMELKKKILTVGAEGLYNSPSESLTPRFSLVAGNNWNNKFGALLNASWANIRGRTDAYDVVRWTKRSYDVDGDGVKEISNAWLMDLPRYIIQQQNVKRLSLSTVFQYRFSKSFDVLLDALYVNNQQTEDRNSSIYFFSEGKKPKDVVVDEDNIIESIGFQTVTVKSENQRQVNDSKHHQLGITGTWKRNYWKSALQLAYVNANKDAEQFRYLADATGSGSYDIRQDYKYWQVTHATDITKPDNYLMSEARQYIWNNHDKEYSGKWDLERSFKKSVLKAIAGGISHRNRTKDRNSYYNRLTNIKEPLAPIATTIGDFMKQEDTHGPSQFVVQDWDLAYEKYGSRIKAKGAEVLSDYYHVNEAITAAYALARFDIKLGSQFGLHINTGVKVAQTTVKSAGNELDKQTKVLTGREVKSDYWDVLPNLNARLTFNNKLQLRAAFAKVLTRPSLTDLSAYREVDDITHTISAKNPDLLPFRADQYDLSAEYYFAKASMVTAGVFHKRIHSFITTATTNVSYNDTIYALTRPVNGNGASITGFELGYQQPLNFLPSPFDGLGLAVNYTYASSTYKEVLNNGEENDYELPNHSKNSYNIIGYYEKYGFSLRMAYNYRSKFLREKPNPADGLKYTHGYGQADVSLGFAFNKHLRISCDVTNIFDATRYEYIFKQKMMDGIFHFGRTVQFGLRASL